MKYLRNFLSATLIVFMSMVMGTAALSEHTPDTTGVWLVTIDFDVFGKPSIKSGYEPQDYYTPEDCMYAGWQLLTLIEYYEPERRFATLCILPDDDDNLKVLVKKLADEFSVFFQPRNRGA